jgi:cation transport protein ChaC
VTALSYVADRQHPQYAGKLSPDDVVAHIRDAIGIAGSNIDYLRNTVQHLDEMGIGDCSLHRILRLLEAQS